MKLQIHTTLQPRSAIGHLSIRMAEELAKVHDVAIIAPAVDQPASTPLPVFHRALDHTWQPIYLIGGHHWFTKSMAAARRRPGLAIIHDATLLDLAVHYFGQRSLGEYLTASRGFAKDFLAQASIDPERFMLAREQAPCTELVASPSHAVVTHSQWAADRIAPYCLGPTKVLRLPAVLSDGPSSVPAGVAQLRAQCDRVVVSVGHANPNRCLADLIAALGSLAATRQSRIGLIVAGPIEGDFGDKLQELADASSVSLLCTGRLSDRDLRGVLESSDACAALRRPVLEAASASVLDQMSSGKPVVVFRSGHYAELPEDAVCFADDPHGSAAEVETDLVRALHTALFTEQGALIGAAGQQYVSTVHTDANYARGVVDALTAASGAVPAFTMMDQLHAQLARLGVGARADLRSVLLSRAAELFS